MKRPSRPPVWAVILRRCSKGLSAERFERFFRASQGSFVVTKEIRDLCTFSAHNLVRDPPFSRMDLVSCRNLLIYMEANLQAAVIPAFHYSLLPGGILLLGGSESTARHEDLFEPLDKAARIFQATSGQKSPAQLECAQCRYGLATLRARSVPIAASRDKISPRHRANDQVIVDRARPHAADERLPPHRPATAI